MWIIVWPYPVGWSWTKWISWACVSGTFPLKSDSHVLFLLLGCWVPTALGRTLGAPSFSGRRHRRGRPMGRRKHLPETARTPSDHYTPTPAVCTLFFQTVTLNWCRSSIYFSSWLVNSFVNFVYSKWYYSKSLWLSCTSLQLWWHLTFHVFSEWTTTKISEIQC